MNDSKPESTNPDEASSEESSQEVSSEFADALEVDSDSQSEPTSQESATSKPRSPVERAIVWGVIGVLLVVVFVEAQARKGYDHALNEITARVSAVDETDGVVDESVVAEIVGGQKPVSSGQAHNTSSGARRVDIYRWDSLFKKRALYVYYGVGEAPEVLAVTTQPDVAAPLNVPVLEQGPVTELVPEKQSATEETQTPAETEKPEPVKDDAKKE